MCKNCYHKRGRSKPAECCPDKPMYSLGRCQNCYMKHYGKEKRKEVRDAKAKIKAEKRGLTSEQFSEKASKSNRGEKTTTSKR